MADTKISALSAVTTPAGTDEFPVNQGGTSLKETLAQIRGASASPSIVSVGSSFSSTGAPTATLPGTHAANDILILVLQSSNQNIAAPSGYTQLGPQNGIGKAATALSTRLGIFWKRDNGSESAPTIADSGDHTFGVMFAVRGCPTVGDPFCFGGNTWKFATSTTGTSPTATTCVDNTLVVDIWAGNVDNAGAEGSSLTNANLTSLTEQFDGGSTDGTGGFIYVSSGVAATKKTVAATTVTWANTSSDITTRIIFMPVDALTNVSAARPAEVQIFIGSTSDLDDTWTKPYGATKVHVQLCDGGGSGSGGNITTTAAGGGGGGGGGYDEAWFRAVDLGATVTLHAGKGGDRGTALNQNGTAGVVSEFPKGSGPLSSLSRLTGNAATAAASADGGNGGGGSGRFSVTAAAARTAIASQTALVMAGGGAAGGNGSTAPVGGSEASWGGGGGESGADTDAATTSANNGNSYYGAGGGSSGRTNTNISGSGRGGGAAGVISAQGAAGTDSTVLPFGGSGGVGGGSTVATGGDGGFPGGGGGGGGGVSGGFGGKGGDGCVVVTTFF